MHFPWKKNKVSRIARLLAGLRQSPKHGGSLVVETGFPTSLVDLFVKNSDRFQKSSKRKCSPNPRILSPDPTPPLPPSPAMGVCEIVSNSIETKDDERIPFCMAFKVCLAVALAVSTRSLAIWITAAALLLVLIEFAWARFWGFLKPESNTLFFCSGIPKGLKPKPRTDELVVQEQGTETLDHELKSELSLSSRIKPSLLKKLVPKKFLHGKRKKHGHKDHGVGAEAASGTEQVDMVSTFDQPLQVESETGTVGKLNSGSVVLVVVVAGLLGGRGVSLLLTLVCCSILELAQRRR